ncbi:hypothetical protein Psi01_28320 [Planobispora siamensis]|uniref:Glyoxalase-like domain-containing protein n=1 Tax=Planobispora siamensis TaxID=936338 RepID=A0A8J3SFY5_9ACTN|nr:hypothetical protein Psi01_28320 [Planobispora siamensis]
MTTRLVQINMKAHDDSALGRFWAEALGWGVSSEGPGVTNLEPEGLTYPDPADVGQGDVPGTVMADPEGNEFCLLAPR